MTRGSAPRWLVLVTTFGLASPTMAQQAPLEDLDAYVRQAVQDWDVPGLALAVVKDDEVVFAEGYGVREVGRPDPVDEHTLFAIASTTKAFVTTALAMLADEGKLSWDDPASRYVPQLELHDPYVTRELTVRDLVTHRGGLAANDLLWYASPNTPDDIVRLLRHQRPAYSFRGGYTYNNNLYAVAGMVVEAASGMPWDEFVRQRILRPLEMDRTLTGIQGLEREPNHAKPHDRVDGEIRPIGHRDLDNIGPAGAMNSSVMEMTRWLRFHLDSTRVDGRRLLSDTMHEAMFTPQTLIPAGSFYPAARLAEPNFIAYGLGWFLQDYHGRKLAMHTGSIDGMSALVALVPEEDLGLVVFANLDHAELRHALMYRVIDAYLGAPTRDWSADLKSLYAERAAQAEARRAERMTERVSGTRPSLEPSAYAGTYEHEMYGEAQVSWDDGRLVLRRGPGFVGDLEHWHYDTYRVKWQDPARGEGYATFGLDARGRPAEVTIQGVGSFRRVAEPETPL